MNKDTSGPAFPGRGLDERGNTTVVATGMTLRQWYAGMAMQGFIACDSDSSVQFISKKLGIDSLDYDPLTHWPQYVALWAFRFADAMLAQEEK